MIKRYKNEESDTQQIYQNDRLPQIITKADTMFQHYFDDNLQEKAMNYNWTQIKRISQPKPRCAEIFSKYTNLNATKRYNQLLSVLKVD